MKKAVIWLLVAALLIGGFVWLVKTPGRAGKLDGFASCIKDSGALFYGAFWCPHCQNQKALFGASAKYLPYIECSTPDGSNQNAVCNEAGVTGYPTWKFADGKVETGEVPLAKLSELTNCPLPE